MIKLVQFTGNDGKPVWVNAARVTAVEQASERGDGVTRIALAGEADVRVIGAAAGVVIKLMATPDPKVF